MKRTLILLIALSFLISCGQGTNKSGNNSEQEVLPVSVDEILSDAAPFVDRTVDISGTVVHVCRHGGQRMFIVGENGEERVRITTGEDIPEFNIELEGEIVAVTGIVKELIIDETYLAEWEAELMEGSNHERGEGHEGGVGHGDDHGEAHAENADAEHTEADSEKQSHEEAEEQLKAQLAKIQSVRDEIAASGSDHLSDYWIETLEFKVISE